MKAEFTIGRVLRPRGIKGVVKIETYSENTSRLLHLRTLNVGGTHYRLENASSERASTPRKTPKNCAAKR